MTSYLDTVKGLRFRVKEVRTEEAVFYLRELSGKIRMEFESEPSMERRLLKMMHASLCDPDGNLTENPGDFDAFMEAVPNRVIDALIKEFSGMIMRPDQLKN